MTGIVVLLVLTEVVLVPLVALLFQAELLAHPFWLVSVVTAGTLGFFGSGDALCCHARACAQPRRVTAGPLYPITVPVIIAGVRATVAIAAPEFDVAVVRFWLSLLIAFDVVFITLALWTFEPVMTD